MIIKHGQHIFLINSRDVQKFLAFVLDCSFRLVDLADWPGEHTPITSMARQAIQCLEP